MSDPTDARSRLMALFRGDGTQTHYELFSSRGGRHAVSAMDAADIILDALHPADLHPEDYCHRCHGPLPSWHAPSPLWNMVMRTEGSDIYNGIVCPNCFGVLAREKGITDYLCVTTHNAEVALPSVSEGGRLWDPDRCMWVDP